MNNLFYQLKKEENRPFLLFFLCMLLIHAMLQLVVGSDDDFMSTAIRSGDLHQLYANNRVVVNFIGAVILSFPLILWKTLNICLLLFLMHYIFTCSKMAAEEGYDRNDTVLKWGICGLFFLLPFNVLSSGAFWATGSINYLWGLCGSLFIVMPFLKDMAGILRNKTELFAGLIFGIYACNTEQSMVIVCIGGAVYLIYCVFHRKKPGLDLFLYGGALILECFPVLFLPYNSYRAIGETSVYFPDFNMLGLLDKLYQGAMHYYNHLVNQMALPFLLLSFFIMVLAYRTTKSRLFHAMSAMPVVYFLFALLNRFTIINDVGKRLDRYYIYNFSNMLYSPDMEKKTMIPFFFATFHFILLFFMILYLLQKNHQKYVAAFFYLAAFADGMMMSFAPSIFVSGNRVFFASDILFLVLTSILGMAAINQVYISESAKKIFTCIVLSESVLLSFAMAIIQHNGIYY